MEILSYEKYQSIKLLDGTRFLTGAHTLNACNIGRSREEEFYCIDLLSNTEFDFTYYIRWSKLRENVTRIAVKLRDVSHKYVVAN
jgi:hypothetical protein